MQGSNAQGQCEILRVWRAATPEGWAVPLSLEFKRPSTLAATALTEADERHNPEHAKGRALTGIGWALLDLAAAIRERGPSATDELAQALLAGRASLRTDRDAYGSATHVATNDESGKE